jgi:nitroimidazol reductase NimA-like FMN-containing flavoprotein (pyridoxamine 5'-phosphate oxidase superfamily)
MIIQEMNQDECLKWLPRSRLARLACAHENQPYIVPVYLAFHNPLENPACFYGFTTSGLKVEWMRVNPLVCVQLDEIEGSERWISVIAMGRYEELPEIEGNDFERSQAHKLLQNHAMWWEPATIHSSNQPEPFIPIYYKIHIDEITGQHASRD